MIKPITAIAICAFAMSAFAQNQTIKVKSRGEDVRTVIDSIFDQSGKHYVLETNYHQTIYANLDGISFQKAIEIIAKVADMEFEERDGIYFIHKKPVTSAQGFAPQPAVGTAPQSKPLQIKNPIIKAKAPAKTASTPKAVTTKMIVAPQGFATEKPTVTKSAPTSKRPSAVAPKANTSARLTVQLRKMDIKEVFAEFGRQANIDIQVDETVPSYKLDAFFYNTTLKFALDKVCKVAGLKYSFTTTNTILITKA